MNNFTKKLKMFAFSSMALGLVFCTFEESRASQAEPVEIMNINKSAYLANGWDTESYYVSPYKTSGSFDKHMFFATMDTRYTCVAESDSNVSIYAYNHLGKLIDFDDSRTKQTSVTFDKGFSGNMYISVKLRNRALGGGYYVLWCGSK